MDPIALLNGWLDTLAGLAYQIGDALRQRRALLVTEVDGTFVLHAAATASSREAPLAVLAAGSRASDQVMKLARRKFIVLECPAQRIVTRHLSVPVQAREFLSGVVRNRIDRLSPWPSGQILYNHHVIDGDTPGAAMLDVQVMIATRSAVESLRAGFAQTGLTADRIVAATDGTPPVSLWSSKTTAAPSPGRMRVAIGGSFVAIIAVCAVTTLWALVSTSAIEAESDQSAERARALQKNATVQNSPQMLAALPPPRRAWVAKENAISTAVLLEDLSRAVPDGAYLSDFQFEDRKLRVSGFADDDAPLIAALERSGHLSDVHFFAPTTRGQDGRLRFSIEAQVEPHLEAKGNVPR
jgi:general secretion pathway protein L